MQTGRCKILRMQQTNIISSMCEVLITSTKIKKQDRHEEHCSEPSTQRLVRRRKKKTKQTVSIFKFRSPRKYSSLPICSRGAHWTRTGVLQHSYPSSYNIRLNQHITSPFPPSLTLTLLWWLSSIEFSFELKKKQWITMSSMYSDCKRGAGKWSRR